MNEAEVRSGKKYPTCSITGARCECGSGGGCDARRDRPTLDPIPKATVRALRSARLLFEGGIEHLDTIHEEYLRVRAYPGPEVREIRRKIVTAIAMVDELGGEL